MIDAIPKDILDLIDNNETVSIDYSSDFLNPHLPKNHFEGQKPVHTPIFNMSITKMTTPHDSNKKPESSTNDIRRYTIRVSVILFNKFFIYCL